MLPFAPACEPALDDAYTLKAWGVVNRTEVDLNFATLKNIVSFRQFDRQTWQSSWLVNFVDGSGGPGNFSFTGNPNGTSIYSPFGPTPLRTFTEEVQLSGKSFGERLDWTTGFFYMNDAGGDTNNSYQSIGTAVSLSNSINPTWGRTNSWGVYGQGTFALTDKLRLTAGLRYSSDHKKIWDDSYTLNAATGAVTCSLFDANNVRLPSIPTQCIIRLSNTWSALTWNFALDYNILPGTMVYVSASRGYRSGSFFPRAIHPNLFPYKPEYLTNYETGLKSDWRLFGQPMRTDLSFYLADQTDMQVQVQDTTTVPLSGFINNAGKSRYMGVEFEAVYRPIPPLTLTAFASYETFKYLSYRDNTGADLSYQTAPEPLTPWSVGGSAEYTVPLGGDSDLVFRADVGWTSKVKTNNINPNAKGDWDQPAYTIVNLRADWINIMGRPVDLGVWVTNLANNWYSNGGTCLNGSCVAVPSPPRMFGGDIEYHF